MKKIPYWYFLLLPSLFLVVGVFLNKLCMAFNGGQMPVLWPGGCPAEGLGDSDLLHTCMTASTRYKFLADWVVVHNGIASPGDFLIDLYDLTLKHSLVIWAVLMIKKVRHDYQNYLDN